MTSNAIEMIRSRLGLGRGLPVDEVFTPMSPVRGSLMFVGRLRERDQFHSAMRQPGVQILVYGDSTSGKTSLVNRECSAHGRVFRRLACPRVREGDSVFPLLRDTLSPRAHHEDRNTVERRSKSAINGSLGVVRGAMDTEERVESTRTLRARTLGSTSTNISEMVLRRNLLLFVDDLERVASDEDLLCLGDLAKQVSDGSFRSAGKCVFAYACSDLADVPKPLRGATNRIRPIYLPRMARGEIRELVLQGMALSQLRLTPEVIEAVVSLADGQPSVAHAICLSLADEVLRQSGRIDRTLHAGDPCVDSSWFSRAVARD